MKMNVIDEIFSGDFAESNIPDPKPTLNINEIIKTENIREEPESIGEIRIKIEPKHEFEIKEEIYEDFQFDCFTDLTSQGKQNSLKTENMQNSTENETLKQIFKPKLALKVNEFKCEPCSTYFNTKIEYKEHVKTTHRGRIPKKCQICGQYYNTLHSLKEHIKRMHSVIEVQCKICKEKFETKDALKTHMTDFVVKHAMKV